MQNTRSDSTADSVQLAGIDKPLSTAVLGTMTFGDNVDEAGAEAMLATALDLGITAIDTANGYARGATEGILGRLLKGRHSDVVLEVGS